jgi:hypothetical protein
MSDHRPRHVAAVFASLAITTFASIASAASFLQVDIDRNASSETAVGWTQLLTGADTITNAAKTFSGLAAAEVDDGTFAVNISGFQTSGTSTAAISIGSRSRSAPVYAGQTTLGNALRDFVFVPSANVQGRAYMAVLFDGLTANTAYDITVFSYENNSAQGTNWTLAAPSASVGYAVNPFPTHVNLADTGSNSVPTRNTGGAAPVNVTNVSAGTTFSVTTDANGDVTLYAWGGNGVDGNTSTSGINPYLSGFTIAVVPEPTSIAALGAASIGLFVRRRLPH